MKDIAVILINFNSSEYTIQCVESIRGQTGEKVNYSIVIVDNHSEYADFEKLSVLKSLENIAFIRNQENVGYSTGNMAGVEKADARYYYFLNNDTILINDALSILFDFMEKKPAAGICSGQMYQEDGSLGINFNYFPDLKLKFLGSGLLRLFSRKEYPKKGIAYYSPLKVPLLNGSSLFVRKEAFNKIGGFDAAFFLYCEEEDLALRMKKAGYSCYLVPEARYIHYEGKSSSRDQGINLRMIREFYISQHYLYRKHYGILASYLWRFSQFLRSIRKFYIHFDYVRLAFFILLHPSMKYSLRNQQGSY